MIAAVDGSSRWSRRARRKGFRPWAGGDHASSSHAGLSRQLGPAFRGGRSRDAGADGHVVLLPAM